MNDQSAQNAPGLIRREPYVLFFPLGLTLAWAGTAHWLLHALGVLDDFRPIFHAMTQIQGFLTAFALGFLFTMIPRRTESAPPAIWQLVVSAIAPVGIVVCAWLSLWAISQVFWITLCAVMLGFVLPRFGERRAGRRPPNVFVFIPIAFVMGIIGAVATGVGAALGTEQWWIHDLGRTLVLQGVFISLSLGVGGLALPLMTRGDKPKDATSGRADRRARAFHLAAAGLLLSTFVMEQLVSLRGALLLRGAVAFAVFVMSADLLQPSKGPGLNRRLLRLAVWMIPLGYLLAGLFHHHWKAGLHVTFIGGFSLLALAVSAQVSLGHGGLGDRLKTWPAPMLLFGVMLLAAIVPRGLMALNREHYFAWMGIAAGLFLLASMSWLVVVVPGLRRAVGRFSPVHIDDLDRA